MNSELKAALNFRDPVALIRHSPSGKIRLQDEATEASETYALLPGLYPEQLGSSVFIEQHKLRFAYVCGAMANGIASEELVIAAARSGFIGFFGAAGLSIGRVADAIEKLRASLGFEGLSFGMNLIHSPLEPQLEQDLVELYLRKDINRVSASAFMRVTPELVLYSCKGLYEENGVPKRRNHLFAKVSRPELAREFMQSPSNAILAKLKAQKLLTDSEVALAQRLPLCEDITLEADSGGHTDRQILAALFPSVLEIRRKIEEKQHFPRPIRLGAAGGIGCPAAAASAFALGADYIVTGSINQACLEAATSDAVKAMLAELRIGDFAMCAAADMFESGVKLQVLKRASLYPQRANWLYELYQNYDSLAALPSRIQLRLEREIFRQSLDKTWQQTCQFWQSRDPGQLDRAKHSPKHQMALVFRSYLGLSSHWAIDGTKTRRADFQIWCGPAMAAFNQWTLGSPLGEVSARRIDTIGLNLLEGACQWLRAKQLEQSGLNVARAAFHYEPRALRLQ